MQLALAPAALAGAQVEDLRPTVSKVYPGSDGKLVYVPDEQGNTIPDFSHAGYLGAGARIPTVPVKETIWPVAGDNTANVQAAIDKVSALPLDKNGFRGALVLRAGYYKMATPVKIQASGVVLRGEGMGDTGTILIGTGNPRRGGPAGGAGTLVMVAARPARLRKTKRSRLSPTITFPLGARSIKVASAARLQAGRHRDRAAHRQPGLDR